MSEFLKDTAVMLSIIGAECFLALAANVVLWGDAAAQLTEWLGVGGLLCFAAMLAVKIFAGSTDEEDEEVVSRQPRR